MAKRLISLGDVIEVAGLGSAKVLDIFHTVSAGYSTLMLDCNGRTHLVYSDELWLAKTHHPGQFELAEPQKIDPETRARRVEYMREWRKKHAESCKEYMRNYMREYQRQRRNNERGARL